MIKILKIFFDLGHGGYDTGAVANGIIERNLNLKVGLLLPALFKTFKNVEIMLSRTDNDTFLSLADRANMANKWGADILVSIHHNAGGGVGFDIIHSVFTNESLGDELALILAEEFKLIGQTKHQIFSKWNSKYNENYYGMIRLANMDSIISEYAFLDSIDHYDIDTDEEVIEEAEAITRAVAKFYKLEEIEVIENISDYEKEAETAMKKAVKKGINDGLGADNNVIEKQLMVFLDRLGLLD